MDKVQSNKVNFQKAYHIASRFVDNKKNYGSEKLFIGVMGVDENDFPPDWEVQSFDDPIRPFKVATGRFGSVKVKLFS